MQSYNAVAKKHGVTHQTVKRIVDASPDISEKVQQKKEENTAEMLAFMESQKGAMQEAIVLHLKALTDPEKISTATLSQIATSFGIIVDKATKNTASSNDSLNKLDGLIREFRDAVNLNLRGTQINAGTLRAEQLEVGRRILILNGLSHFVFGSVPVKMGLPSSSVSQNPQSSETCSSQCEIFTAISW